jgi:membrane associated rhomboid family serine protease
MGFRPEDLFSGDPSRMATIIWHMFAHGSWMHLLWNSFFLILFGIGLEIKIKRRGLLLCFIAGGIGGSLFSTSMAYLAPDFFNIYPATHSVGASGGISGVLGTYFILYPNDRPFSGRRVKGFFTVWMMVLIYLSIETFWMFTNLQPGVGHGAHIGGLIAGLLVAPAVRRLIPPAEDGPREMSEGSLEELRSMAGEEGLEDLYRKIEEEDIPDVRQAWAEQLIKKSRCPRCGRGLKAKGGVAKCDCGWRLRY